MSYANRRNREAYERKGTPQPGPMGANGTTTVQPLDGLASTSGSARLQPPVDNAHVAWRQQFTGMKMSYAVEQRLRMVDFLLDQYGHVKSCADGLLRNR